jgi:hypothetical protein
VPTPERAYTYTLLVDPEEEDGGDTVTVPALPGAEHVPPRLATASVAA